MKRISTCRLTTIGRGRTRPGTTDRRGPQTDALPTDQKEGAYPSSEPEMKIVRNRLIPVPGFTAMNLCGVLFVRGQAAIDDEMLRHECIHTRQMREMGYVPFYVWYVAAWLLRLLVALVTLPFVDRKGRRHHLYDAYAHLWFEREAYGHAADALYLQQRRPYAWLTEPLSAVRSGCRCRADSGKGKGAKR